MLKSYLKKVYFRAYLLVLAGNNVLTKESDLSFNLFFKGESDRFHPLDVIKQL